MTYDEYKAQLAVLEELRDAALDKARAAGDRSAAILADKEFAEAVARLEG